MAKEINPLECECGHIAGAPATLRIHQNTHAGETALDKAIDKVTKPIKKLVKSKQK